MTGNAARDEENLAKLRANGISALVFWECDVLRDPDIATTEVAKILAMRKDHG